MVTNSRQKTIAPIGRCSAGGPRKSRRFSMPRRALHRSSHFRALAARSLILYAGRSSRLAAIMGHRLSKIVTRTGDAGTTGLGDGSRVGKHSARIEAIGAVDELNSTLGV